MNGGRCKPYVPSLWDKESELNIVNNVLVAVVSGHIVIFKEKWENWQFLDINKLKKYKKEMRRDKENGKGLWSFEDRDHVKKEDKVEEMERICKYCLTSLFQLVTVIKIEEI